MNLRFAPAFIAGAACLLIAATAAAQTTPATINYQGRLTDNSPQQTLIDTTAFMTFEIWDVPAGGTVIPNRLWLEPQSGSVAITVSKGIFSVLLGSNGVPLPASTFSGGTARYLQLIISGETLTPRQAISSVGYCAQAENASNAATVTNGVTTTGFYADPVWITSLAGSKISGAVASATTTASFSGPLAGDVTGTQGATSVAGLQGRAMAATAPAANQVIQWGGAQWQPATPVHDTLTGAGGPRHHLVLESAVVVNVPASGVITVTPVLLGFPPDTATRNPVAIRVSA